MKRSTLLARSFSIAAFACAIGGSPVSPLKAQNLVADPGFEASTDLPNGNPFSPAWTLNELNGFSVVGANLTYAHTGTNYAALAPNFNAIGSLSQVLSTTSGSLYTVTFWLASDRTTTVDNSFAVLWDGVKILSLTNVPAPNNSNPYANFTFDNLAVTGTATTLEFRYMNNDDYFRLDDVSVSVVPEMSATSFALLGFAFLGVVCYRRKRVSRFGIGL